MISFEMEKVQPCDAAQECDATMFSHALKLVPKKYFFLTFLILSGLGAFSQLPDHIYKSSISEVRFHMYGDQYSLPVYNVNSGDQLELNFDDMDNDVKSYYYTFQP